MKKNLIIFGLGPHAQACQYKFLENLYKAGLAIKILLLAELQDQQTNIETFFEDKELLPEQIIGLPPEDRNSDTINPKLLSALEAIKDQVDGVLICTEPKAHKKYILWALQNNIDVLTDKPLTACNINQKGPQQLWQDYLDIEKALASSKARVTLLTNKRIHPAYKAVYDITKEFVCEYKVPITQIEISEGGGVWNFPCEFAGKENHPYKYGYGILLHTGFHYVDLLLHYQSINHLIGFKEDSINIHAFGTTPFDVLHQISKANYENLFSGEDFSEEFKQIPWDDYKKFGIVDALVSLQFLKEGAVITQSNLNMLQNTLSARDFRPAPKDPYLGSGRLTQNYISIFCGPLFHIHLNFFQPDLLPEDDVDNYIVEIYRNTQLIGGKSYEKIESKDSLFVEGEGNISLNYVAKRNILENWLEDSCPTNDFALHKRAVKLTADIFEEILKRRKERFN